MNITPKNGLTDKFRPPATKVCRLCKEEKAISSFSQNIKNKDGYMHECRACMKDREDQKVQQRKENAKTFFDAKYFTFFFLLLSATAFSQDTAKHRIDLKAQGWTIDTIPPYVQLYKVFYGKNGAPDTMRLDTKRAVKPTNDSLFIPPYCNTAGVTLITYRPDTVRAIILVTMSPNGIAHARMGFVVLQQGKRPIYLDCRKQALKRPQVGWDFRQVDVNYKQKQ